MKRIALFTVVAFLAANCFAQAPACPSATLANVLGTSCSIGNVTFTFQNNFQGNVETETTLGTFVLTPLDPNTIAFTPTISGSQTGFTLITNFVDNPAANGLLFSSHAAAFSYSTQVNGAFEILGEQVSAVSTAPSPGSVFVEEQQCYPNQPCTFITLNKPVGTLVFPSLGSQSEALFSFTDLQTVAQGLQQTDLISATFLYTVKAQAPPPPPAKLNYQNIDLPGVEATFAAGINNRGEIAGSFQDSSGVFHGYITDRDGNALTTLDFPSATSTFGAGINDRKDFVGAYTDNDGTSHGFALQNGSFSTIDFPGAIFNAAEAINERGQIAGIYQNPDFSVHAYLFENGVFTTIDAPTGFATQISSINDRSDMVGFVFDNFVTRSFLLSHGVFLPITVPAGEAGVFAFGLNDPGDVTGYFEGADMVPHGFQLIEGLTRTVDFPNAGSTLPSQINSEREIVGIYTDGSGAFHSFLATPEHGGDDVSVDAAAALQTSTPNAAAPLNRNASPRPCGVRQPIRPNQTTGALTCNSPH